MAAAPVESSGETASCTNIAYLKDPASTKLSIVRIAAAGTAGGAAGGILGRSLAKESTLSCGRAAGVGAAGGMVAGVLIGAIIDMGVGKIVPALQIRDAAFMGKLRGLAANGVAVTELRREIPRRPPTHK